ncbi:MAG: esterase-like activity of phytase family protein [Pseudomonadota bacterium]|nr:esterase-like activity of phytase family protein [Pseudomonadota bacterium]
MRTRGAAAALALALGAAGCGGASGADDADGRFEAPGWAVALTMRGEARLRLIGVVDLGAPAAGFGGFSGLEVSADGARLVALSDRGMWLEAGIARAGGPDRPATGLTGARLLPLLAPGPEGAARRPAPVWRDAEGLAIADPDLSPPWFASFEQVHRVDRFAGPAVAAEPFAAFDAPLAGVAPPEGNKGFEALAVAPDGRLLAIREAWDAAEEEARWIAPDGAQSRATQSRAAQSRATLPRDADAPAVGADFAPDGALWLLRRRFEPLGGFAFSVWRHAPDGEGFAAGERMLDLPFGDAVDNAEGLAVWFTPDGRTRILLISDDNFLPLQRTLLYEFELEEPRPGG